VRPRKNISTPPHREKKHSATDYELGLITQAVISLGRLGAGAHLILGKIFRSVSDVKEIFGWDH